MSDWEGVTEETQTDGITSEDIAGMVNVLKMYLEIEAIEQGGPAY
jgi:hypothetical protein